MKPEIETTTRYFEQTERMISQRQFCKKYGTTPALMNYYEDLGLITSKRGQNPRGTRRYLEKETWQSIIAYMHKPDETQETASAGSDVICQTDKFKLRRREKHA